jgi:release factor glutamine methyltransferase
VRLFEPKLALTADDGLKFYRVIAEESSQLLSPGGAIVLEIGADQGDAVTALLQKNGFKDVTVKKDYAGRDRIVSARR